MPVEFLTDEQAAVYGRFTGPLTRAQLERYFFLDDSDKTLIRRRRGDHSRLGFGLQLVTVRYLGTFLTDPLDVPAGVAGYLAEQLGIEDASCVKRYTERDKTRLEHAWEIQRERELRDFAAARDDLTTWIFARAWTTGEGPKTIFDGSVSWLREHNVLLPGVSVLARLVASVRDEAAQRLWETLYDLMTAEQHRVLDALLEVPGTARTCEFDRLRKGPTKQSGAELVKALDRIAQIAALNIGSIDLAAVPERRIIELGRYGLAGKTPALKRRPIRRRLATMLAAVYHLESTATDDALELLDVLMATRLLARAQREADQITLKRYPRFARASATLAAAIEVLFEVTGYGEEISLEQLWESIEAIVPRSQLAAAVAAVTDNAPAPGADPDGEWRAAMAAQIGTVRGFVKILTEVIRFGTTAEGEPVLAAMKALPGILAFKSRKHSATLAPAKMIDEKLVTGDWRRLVYRAGAPRAWSTRPLMCSACWKSSTGSCGAGTFTPRPRVAGVIRVPACWTASGGRRPNRRRSRRCGYRKIPGSCWPCMPRCWMRPTATWVPGSPPIPM